jgi:hypothetical protein
MAKPSPSRLGPLLAAGALVASLALDARAAGPNITLEGKIELPPGGVKEPSNTPQGFIERIANPVAELKPYDPRPECFVALDGGPAAPEAAAASPRPITWELQSANFSPALLPVVTGSKVEIKNVGRQSHHLAADGAPELFGSDPIGPDGKRQITAGQAGKALVIRDSASPHLEARLVAMPNKYFSRLKKDGSYAIEDVPQGKWTVKVWCRDGWVSSTKVVEVARGARGDLVLPERLEAAGNK